MRTDWVCVHTQSSIHGSSTHIRAQERPDSINKEAKQITLASSQCMCMRVHANTHAYKYTKCGGYVSSSCALTVVFWSKHTKIINLISLSEWVLLFFPKQMLLCCLWVCRRSERHGWKYWFSPPSQLQPKHHSCFRHYVKKFIETEWEFSFAHVPTRLQSQRKNSADVQPKPWILTRVVKTFNCYTKRE